MKLTKTCCINAKGRVRNGRHIDVAVDPPPDLRLEVDISSSQNKLPTYATFGVGEVWRYGPAGFEAFALIEGADANRHLHETRSSTYVATVGPSTQRPAPAAKMSAKVTPRAIGDDLPHLAA